jgi:hypothetical protein
MPIVVPCPCGATLRAPDNAAGKTQRCPKCQAFLTVPPSAALDQPAPAEQPHGNGSPLDVSGNGRISPQSDLGFDLPGSGVTTEPWYYGFLDRYALILKWMAIVVFGGMAVVVTGIAVFWCIGSIATVIRIDAGNAGNFLAFVNCLAAAAFWVVSILQLALAFVLSLVGVAYIHLAVDAARNIRALNLKHG